jgi:pimeloyl-ACP methyl ester carboxylesterase
VVDGSGPPLLQHHGFTGSSRDWETFGFVAVLRERFQVIMLDARGHGASDKPHDPGAYTVEDRVGDVLAVLDDLGIERAHYYGYSYGGMMGWALGAHAPERFASLAIGGAHPFPLADAVWTRLERMRSFLREGMEAYIAWRERQIGPWPPAFRERVLENDAQALVATLMAAPAQDHADGLGDRLSRMTMPVLVLTGDDDDLYAGSQARRAAEALPDADFVEISAADHFTLYVRSDLILPHLTAFLDRVTAAPNSGPDDVSSAFVGISAYLHRHSDADQRRVSKRTYACGS